MCTHVKENRPKKILISFDDKKISTVLKIVERTGNETRAIKLALLKNNAPKDKSGAIHLVPLKLKIVVRRLQNSAFS